MPCPPKSGLASYSEGRSSPSDRAIIESHLAECSECRKLVSLLAQAVSSGSAPTVMAAADSDEQDVQELLSTYRRGTVLGGKYRVERPVGAGGMGVVLEATHLGLQQRVALKLLKKDAKRVPGAVDRFVREARACASIKSTHAVRVLDTGQFDSGEPYMVMELLDGEDLRARMIRKGPLPISEAADIILEACDALDEAHKSNIVHRDIKPANLFVTSNKDGVDVIKVLDFGISKLQDATANALTTQSVTMGSPRYMSPEQLTSPREVDARADVWALGVVLYELVSGRPAFDAETLAGLAAKIMTKSPDPLAVVRPDAPRELQSVIDRCLARDRSHRFAGVAALAGALRLLASGRGRPIADRLTRSGDADLPAVVSRTAPPASGYEATLVAVTNSPQKSPSAFWVVAPLAALILLVGVVGVFMLMRTPPHKPPVGALVTSETPSVASSFPVVVSSLSTTAPSASAAATASSAPPRASFRSPVAKPPVAGLPSTALSVPVAASASQAPRSTGTSAALRDRQ